MHTSAVDVRYVGILKLQDRMSFHTHSKGGSMAIYARVRMLPGGGYIAVRYLLMLVAIHPSIHPHSHYSRRAVVII